MLSNALKCSSSPHAGSAGSWSGCWRRPTVPFLSWSESYSAQAPTLGAGKVKGGEGRGGGVRRLREEAHGLGVLDALGRRLANRDVLLDHQAEERALLAHLRPHGAVSRMGQAYLRQPSNTTAKPDGCNFHTTMRTRCWRCPQALLDLGRLTVNGSCSCGLNRATFIRSRDDASESPVFQAHVKGGMCDGRAVA
jgi:hypothetical protein